MDQRIKEGATLLTNGIKAEAKTALQELVKKLDSNADGKLTKEDLAEVSALAKDSTEKLKKLVNSDEVPEKIKADINVAIEKLKPLVEAKKMEMQIEKERIAAEIEHAELIEEKKSELE